jgi:UDP-N-acetylmuramate--alanine ligase
VKRRLELVGEANGILVYDDYSHNPAKITAALDTVRQIGTRVIGIYQPHGYGPTRLLREELVRTFNERMTSADILIMLDIYYAGGTADRSLSSGDLVREVRVPKAEHLRDREEVIRRVDEKSEPGDVIVVMGARDNTLSELAKDIVHYLERREGSRHKPKCAVT